MKKIMEENLTHEIKSIIQEYQIEIMTLRTQFRFEKDPMVNKLNNMTIAIYERNIENFQRLLQLLEERNRIVDEVYEYSVQNESHQMAMAVVHNIQKSFELSYQPFDYSNRLSDEYFQGVYDGVRYVMESV